MKRALVFLLLVGMALSVVPGSSPFGGIPVASATVAFPSYPYQLDTGREVGLYAAGGLLLAAAWSVDRYSTPPTEEEIRSMREGAPPEGWHGFDLSARRRWSPTAAKVSDLTAVLSLTAPVIQAGEGLFDDDTASLAVMYGETVLLTAGATALVKALTHRPRPFLYNDDPSIPEEVRHGRDAWRSFPSGHTALAFAGVVHLGMVNQRLHPGSSGWVWSAGLGVAALTGVLRYVAGKHHPTDILAGAALGSFVGWFVPTLHEDLDNGLGGDPLPPLLTVGFAF